MGRKHTVRHKTRRKLDGCAHQCDVINGYLAEISEWYSEQHPEVDKALLEIGCIVEAVRSLLLELRKAM